MQKCGKNKDRKSDGALLPVAVETKGQELFIRGFTKESGD